MGFAVKNYQSPMKSHLHLQADKAIHVDFSFVVLFDCQTESIIVYGGFAISSITRWSYQHLWVCFLCSKAIKAH